MSIVVAVLATLLGSPSQAHADDCVTLFTIARSTNANIVHYDGCVVARGDFWASEPVTAYWRMHAERGQREELTWFERQFAYGFDLSRKAGAAQLALSLAALPERPASIHLEASKPRATLTISGRRAILHQIFVQTDPRSTLPSVLYVELRGADARTGRSVRERIEP
jgi:hypothetical protein